MILNRRLDELESEELLREMHNIISTKTANRQYNLNLLTPENLKRFEEEQILRNRNLEFLNPKYEDIKNLRPITANKCLRLIKKFNLEIF